MVLGAAPRSFDFLFSGAFPDNWAARHCSYGEEMTDRELLEMAAKAAGKDIDLIRYDEDWGFAILLSAKWWNPLTDDGDALRLAVRMRIAFKFFRNAPPELGLPRLCALATMENGNWFAEEGADEVAATRRAIVRAAAEIGKAMK